MYDDTMQSLSKFIIWNNKEIKVNSKSVFYKHYFDMDIKYTKDLLYNMSNIESFNIVREAELSKSNFLEWTGLRLAVPPSLGVYELNFKDIFNLESFKCHDYYCHHIRHKYEKPSKWPKLKEEFNLTEENVSEAFLLPIRVAYSTHFSIKYYILFCTRMIYYTNKIRCSFCQQTTEVSMSHIFLIAFFQNPFGTRLCNCRCLSLSYQDTIIGVLKEEIDLFNNF